MNERFNCSFCGKPIEPVNWRPGKLVTCKACGCDNIIPENPDSFSAQMNNESWIENIRHETSSSTNSPSWKDLVKGVGIIWSFNIIVFAIIEFLKHYEILKGFSGTCYFQFLDIVVTLIVIWSIICVKYRKSFPEGFSIHMVKIKILLMSIIIGIVLAVIGFFLMEYIVPYFPIKDAPIEKFMSDSKGFVFIIMGSIFFAPIIEEIYYRGFWFPILRKELGALKGIIFVSLWFGLLHGFQLGGHVISIIFITFVGFILTLIRHKSESLIPSILTHLSYNFSVFFVPIFFKVLLR